MTDAAVTLDGVPKPTIQLRNDNYRAYHVKTTAALRGKEWLGLVKGTDLCPAPAAAGSDAATTTAANKAIEVWKKKQQRVASFLVLSISDEEVDCVYGIDDDPVAIWNKIEGTYGRKSEAEAETASM